MKQDIATTVVVGLFGSLISFFLCGIFLPAMQDFIYKDVEIVSSSLSEPSMEMFNPNSINPTVEIILGECTEYDEEGNCVENTFPGADGEIETSWDLDEDADVEPEPENEEQEVHEDGTTD